MMGQPGERLTLMVVADGTQPVRRFHLETAWLRKGALLGCAVLLLGALGSTLLVVDYLRLRREAVDVAALRAESGMHRQELERLAAELGALASGFDGLAELERKVRVIANLPRAVVEAQVPDEATAGRGGEEEIPEEATDRPSPAGLQGALQGAGSPTAEPQAAAPGSLDAATLARLRGRAQQLAERLPPRRSSLEDLLQGLEGKSRQLASTPSIWPTDGWVTSHYGHRTSPFTGRRQFHGGIDIAADFGTPVVAPARARVAFAGKKGPLGNTVVLDHGFGLRTTYGHNGELLVKRGSEVERGTPIAVVGSSGRSTGPHLHYALEAQGRSVNPADYIFE
jgi:murein DD-endopeptidase MepM/ murein hydrolase activator NlpD